MEYRIFRLLLGSIIAVGLLSGLFSSIGFGRRILCGGASLTMWRVQLWIAVRFAFFLCVCKCVLICVDAPGTVLSLIFIFLTLQAPKGGINFKWWGNTVHMKSELWGSLPPHSFIYLFICSCGLE